MDSQIEEIVDKIFFIQFLISILGFIINLFHLTILTKKSMRTSCTNTLIIGISICDLIVLSVNIHNRLCQYWIFPNDNPCVNRHSYYNQVSRLIGNFLSDNFERSSFWIGIFLALIRLLVMKNQGKSGNLVNVKTGYFLLLLVLVLGSCPSLWYYSKHRFSQRSIPWRPGQSCPGFPSNYSEYAYNVAYTNPENEMVIMKKYLLISGFSAICVSLIYPILALSLFLIIWNASKTNIISRTRCLERQKTAKMILLMTIFYVISSAPGGIINFIEIFVHVKKNSILQYLIGYGTVLISVLFCLNSISHCIICFSMSSKYRDTARKMVGKMIWRGENKVFVMYRIDEVRINY